MPEGEAEFENGQDVIEQLASIGLQPDQPVEKVQVISSFYPWRAKLERKWQHGRKICSSIVDFLNRLLRFLPISRAIGLCGKRGAFPRTPSTSRGSGEVRIQHQCRHWCL